MFNDPGQPLYSHFLLGFLNSSKPNKNHKGMCNTNLHFIHIKIDLTDERNKNPKQHLEENEFIEVFTVPLKDLYKVCRRMEKEGFAIDARVGSLAEGIEVARKWNFL